LNRKAAHKCTATGDNWPIRTVSRNDSSTMDCFAEDKHEYDRNNEIWIHQQRK
jgi:hypothetical protein